MTVGVQPKYGSNKQTKQLFTSFAKLVFDKSSPKRMLPYFDLAESTFVQANLDSDFEWDSHDGVEVDVVVTTTGPAT